MKQYYSYLFLLTFNIILGQNFTDTKGELQISGSGTAVYNLPIATPPSIQNIAPVINLTYSSGTRGGIAGQGWSINNISAISRIATRNDIDGFFDGVDFDSNDKLALDGQRLLLKTGTYWANGSTYETEFKSNSKIELKIESSFLYFILTAPDGSRTWYASRGGGNYQNAISANAWYIVHFEDVNGNEINYNYINISYNSTNQLYIKTIDFSGNSSAGIAFQNQIEFNYKSSSRIERDFINGSPFYATQILDNIMVRTNSSLFRKYQLQHQTDSSLGYQRVSSIQESNGSGELSNPVVFTYNSTMETLTRIEKEYTNTLAFDKANIAGDFDGDGRLDFVADKKIYTNLFTGNTGNAGINFPTIRPTLIFPATVKQNYKINQFQSIIEPVASNSQIQFVAYNIVDSNLNYTGLTSSIIQTIVFDNTIFIDPSYKDEDESFVPPLAPPQAFRDNEYLAGDFDGDGISEVLILSKDERLAWEIFINSNGYSEGGYWRLYSDTNSDYRREARLAYLSTGESKVLQGDSYYICATGKRYVADMNGDGKSDIININQHGQYSIVEINKLPSGEIEVKRIGSGTLSDYSHTRQILFGDFNGDGKTDIMLPTSEGGEGQTEWNIYYANPKPTGGNFFFKETLDIVEYRPDTGSYYNTQRHWSNYYAIDINGDGKSDLVRVWRKYFKASWTINNHDTQWRVTGYTNNIDKAGASGFPLTYDSGTYESGSPDIPIPIVSNYKYDGSNSELVIVRGHYNKIEYYQFGKNVDTDNRLKSVSEAGGNVIQTIDYLPMMALNGGVGNNPADFYATSSLAFHPYILLIKNENSYLVSRLTATINGVSKFQEFRYRNYVSNYNWGTIGFGETARSSWYLNSSDTKIWSINYYSYGSRGYIYATYNHNDSNNVFNFSPSSVISEKYYNYTDYSDGFVLNYRLDDIYTYDKISGVNTFENFLHDPDDYGLVTTKTVESFLNNTLQSKTITNTSYDNNPNGTGTNYYIGRPNEINTSTTYGNDTRTSQEKLFYSNGNVTRTEKTGHNTYAIIEDMTYDILGNLLTKTVSAPTASPAPVPRAIKDEYDSTKRFVVKKTDHQGFVTNLSYNNLGQVTQSTDYLGVISDFIYDNWGKLNKSTVTGSSITPLTTLNIYNKLGTGGYTVTTTNSLEAKTVTEYDVLGRVVKSATKGFASNSMISRQTVYDGLGRKVKESDPYFFSPSIWTNFEYDFLLRPTKITAPTGKIQTFSYTGVTTTSNDDGKVTIATLDALGNKIQSTDPGGTINFTYYANGQLKESDYQGNKVQVEIDGWGNKVKLTDPSAGVYTYSYDAFGKVLRETAPNGTTSFTYDAAGKTIEKSISGNLTNTKTTYVYNSLNQITSATFVDNIESKTTTNVYEYDSLKRLYKTTETTPYAIFVKEISFDLSGRVDKETSTVSASGKTSSKTIKNTYQNGFPWQILDDTSQQVLWQSNSLNERAQLTGGTFGNGITVNNSYDQYGYVKQIKHDKTGTTTVNIMTLNTDFEIKRGNLNSRTNSLFGRNETFNYDSLDRLTEYTNVVGIQEAQVYDDKGRITQNSLGTYEYDGAKTYQNKTITPTPDALAYYTAKASQIISYNAFKSPIKIEEEGIDKISFTYNDGNDRSSMFYGSLENDKLLRLYRKHYSADGSMEIKHNTVTGKIEFFTYIGGDGYSAPVVLKSDGITENYLYLHRDYQGTIVAISDQNASIVEKRLFDAWGSIVKVQDGAGNTLAGLTILDRGYTGHEHLQSVGIIHMNGRLYDPKLHRFLQPDNFIQDLNNTQNYNRYGYVLNNPLKYTDPSGEAYELGIAVGVGVAIAALTYTFTALLADVPFTVGGLVKTAFIGAASAAVTFGIGSAVGTITNFYVRTTIAAVAHGTFQGSMTSISGGKFWSSFAAGALSSIASSAWQGGGPTSNYHGAGSFASSGVGMIAFGTVSGGVGAKLTGGNFWQGAVTGLVVSGLNHAMHKISQGKVDSEVNVLLDTEGASGHGHMAMLAGNDEKGWRFVSKEGRAVDNSTDGQDGNMYIGGKSAVLDLPYSTKALALSEHPVYDRFLTYKTTYSNAMRAINETYRSANSYYHVILANCGHAVADGLSAIGYYSGSAMEPKVRYEQILRYNNNNHTPLNSSGMMLFPRN